MRGIKIPTYSEAKINLFDLRGGMNGEIDSKSSDVAFANLSYNFELFDGALKDGFGLKEFSFPKGAINVFPSLPYGRSPIKCFYYKRFDVEQQHFDDRLLCFASDNYVYECKLNQSNAQMTLIEDLHFSKVPHSVCYKYNGDDVIIFSIDGTMKIYDGISVVSVNDVPDVTSMCLHSERLFVTTGGEQTALWFSDDFDPTDWYVSLDEAGFIDFQDGRGRLLKVVSFNNYVYIFRNYGITRLTAFGDQTEFVASGLFLSSGRIFHGSIAECGNRIIYLAEDGFYSFDGIDSNRILKEYDKYLKNINNDDAVGKYFNGKLYMSLNMRLNGKILRVMLVYDTKNGGSYIAKGLRVRDVEIVSTNEFCKLVFVCENSTKLGTVCDHSRFFNRPLKKIWKSNFNDFNIVGEKVLKKLSLYTKNRIEVEVKSEVGTKKIIFDGAEFRQTAIVGLKGKTFEFSVLSDIPKCEVSRMILYFNYFND